MVGAADKDGDEEEEDTETDDEKDGEAEEEWVDGERGAENKVVRDPEIVAAEKFERSALYVCVYMIVFYNLSKKKKMVIAFTVLLKGN